MATDSEPSSARAGARAFVSLLRDVATFSGRKGIQALIYIALGAIFESFGLLLIVPLLAVVIGGVRSHGRLEAAMSQTFAATGATTPEGRLGVLLAGFALVMLVRAVVITLRDTSVMNIQIRFVEQFRERIVTALMQAGWDRVLRLRHARVLSLLGADVQRISNAAHYLMLAGIAVVILLAQCVLAFFLSPVLALFAIGLLVVGALAMVPVLKRTRDLGRYVSLANMALTETAAQFLSGLKFAISQDLQGSFVFEFQRTITTLANRQLEFFRRQTIGRVALTTISAIVGMVVVFFGYSFLGLSAPILVAFLLVVARMTGPATQVQQGFQQLAQGLPSYESIMELIAELHTVAPPPGPSAPRTLEGPIVLDGVTYQHAADEDGRVQGVRSVSLTVAPGTVLGIGGTSGAGKTTLADLLVGLLKPQLGRITVGGVPLDDAALPAWRAQLSYVAQDPFLFHDSVRRNLAWANPQAGEEEMWQALTLAGADTIVRRLEGGLDAVVGDRGSLLSGGERQRVALARALLRKPKILIMDEATNAIDIPGERSLLERLVAGHTMTAIIIAHRAETLALCDRVVRMDGGRLYEDEPRLLAAGV